jgi:hypothetical protein
MASRVQYQTARSAIDKPVDERPVGMIALEPSPLGRSSKRQGRKRMDGGVRF